MSAITTENKSLSSKLVSGTILGSLILSAVGLFIALLAEEGMIAPFITLIVSGSLISLVVAMVYSRASVFEKRHEKNKK